MRTLLFSLAILALASCEKEPQPVKASDLVITQVVASQWPATRPDGTAWSANNIFPASLTISERGTNHVLYASPPASAAVGVPITFRPGLKISQGKELVITLWALEGQISEIGGYWFEVNESRKELFDSSVGVRFLLFWE